MAEIESTDHTKSIVLGFGIYGGHFGATATTVPAIGAWHWSELDHVGGEG